MMANKRGFPPGGVEPHLFQRTILRQSDEFGASTPALVAKGIDTTPKRAGFGLRTASLSPMETLAQSISGACPTLTPFVTVPLVFTLTGNGTWLVYILGTCGILLVAWCISRFARYSSSPGSLYSYAAMILPPWLGAVAAWSLLLAYVMGTASNIGAFYYYANVMILNSTGREISVLMLATIYTVPFIWIAWRDVKLSARAMLVMEGVSVSAVVAVMALILFHHGLHGDSNQVHLRGVTGSGFRQGLVLALYSFVGFEGATVLGSEARNPLKAIPRAVILTSVLGGLFFTICAYTEVLGFGMSGKDLGTSNVPMHVLASVGGFPVLGFLIDLGALVSLFAGSLAGITAAARVLLQMSHNGLTHASFRKTHARNETPTGAVIVTGLVAFVPVAFLASRGTSGVDVYGWLGMMAVYGFVVSYGLVCFALPGYLRAHHGVSNLATKTIPYIACAAMVYALVANLYPVTHDVYGKLPYIFFSYLIAVVLFSVFRSREQASMQEDLR
jgi:amino acid transporter